jgi:DNA repair exonuclease SbcCD ATPase subunit
MKVGNEHLGESFTSLTDGVDQVFESVGELKGGFAALGQTGVAGISALIGPVSMLITGVVALYEAFTALSGAMSEAEAREEAMAAAASDLQSKLEALSEKGIELSTEKLMEFTEATFKAQVGKELLQKRMEKLTKVYTKSAKAEEKLTKERGKLNHLTKDVTGNVRELMNQGSAAAAAQRKHTKATDEYRKKLGELQTAQKEVNKDIKAAAELEEAAEEMSVESLQTKAKERSARLKNIKLLALESGENTKYIESLKNEVEEKTKLLELRAKSEDKSKLQELNKEIEKNIKLTIEQSEAVDEAALIQLAAIRQRIRLEKEADDKERELAERKRKARRQAAQRRRQMQEQQARQEITDQARTQALEIQLAFDGFKEREELARLAYETEIKLAKDNADKKYQAELRLQLQLKEIDQARLEQTKKDAAEVEKNRLAIEAKAAKERDARLKREEAERQKAIDQAKTDYEDLLSSVEHYSSGLANAAAGAILFGDSVSEGVAQALNALASEAAVSALIETAKGIASTFTNPAEASTHFAAAGQFAIAAGAARGASALLGGGGGGGVTTGAASSPSGAPQTATAPARAEAMESQVVYNINFGGAVIYDSKRAAEQALADRITTIQNQRRRGAPIPRRA